MPMSNYPIWWDSTITIYNKYENPDTHQITWYSHIIPKCFWKYVGDKVEIGNSILETNSIICRIPENELFKERYIWNDLLDKSSNFTLGVGDIIVNGEVSDVIDEYTSGRRSSDLINKYKNLQGCMQIERVALNKGIGRVCPHYSVKGI